MNKAIHKILMPVAAFFSSIGLILIDHPMLAAIGGGVLIFNYLKHQKRGR